VTDDHDGAPTGPPPAPQASQHGNDVGKDAGHAARSGAVQVLTAVAQGVIAATQVIFARLYGAATLGAYQAAYALIEVAARGGTGGADKAMLRYVAAARANGDSEAVRRALGTGLRLCLIVAGSIAVILAAFAGPIARLLGEPALAPAIRVMAPVPVLLGCLWILIQASLAARITRANFYVRGLLEPAALLAAGVAAFFLGGALRGLAGAQVAASSLTLVVGVLVVRRALRPGELGHVLSAPRVPGFARFALPISAGEALNAIYQRVDIIIVTAVAGPRMASYYAAAELLTRVVANIRYAFDSIVAGVMSETLHLGQRDRMSYNLRLTTRWVVSVAAPLAVSVIALRHDLLRLWGREWLAASGALVVLSASHFLNASLGLVHWVLLAGGRSRLGLMNQFLGVAFNVTACLLLTPRYGITGTALAVLGTVAVVQAAGSIEVALIERVHVFQPALLKPLLAAAACGLAQAALARAIDPVWLRVPAVIAGGGLVYLAALLLLRLPPEERRMARRVLASLRPGRGGAIPPASP
jgi:O-antigen/teichoic acid export membrane protein